MIQKLALHRVLAAIALVSLLLAGVAATEDCREYYVQWPCDQPFCYCQLSETEGHCENAPNYQAFSGAEDSELTCIVWGDEVSVGGYNLLSPPDTDGCGAKFAHGEVSCIWVLPSGHCGCTEIQVGQPASGYMPEFECDDCEITRNDTEFLFHELIPNERVVIGTTISVQRD